MSRHGTVTYWVMTSTPNPLMTQPPPSLWFPSVGKSGELKGSLLPPWNRGIPTVYRLYNSEDQLLYVGATGKLHIRLLQHARSKPWWKSVSRITTCHFDDVLQVGIAEREVIRTEQPLHNVRSKAVL